MSAFAVAAIAALLASAPDSKAAAKTAFEEAQASFRLGHFEDALTGYTRAYELLPAPDFLFNIGQCHRNLGQYERAIFFFESFLVEAPASPERPRVERLIAELEEVLKERAKPEPSPVPPPVIGTSTITIPIVIAIDTPPVYERVWFWGVVLGAAALVGGAIAVGVTVGKDDFPYCDQCFDLRK